MHDSILRTDMSEAMVEFGHAKLRRPDEAYWPRANLLVIEQGSGQFEAACGFHLVELTLHGSQSFAIQCDCENGSKTSGRCLPGMVHYTHNGTEMSCKMRGTQVVQQVCIDQSVFDDAMEALSHLGRGFVEPISFFGVYDSRLKMLMDLLLDEARLPQCASDVFADMLVMKIALILTMRRMGITDREPARHTLSQTELSRVSDYVEAHLNRPLSLNRMAATLGMDTVSFFEAFQKTTGLVPDDYVTQRRIAVVKDRMALGADTLPDIARAAGFSSPARMARVFNQQIGLSPAQWRRDVRARGRVLH